MLYSALLCSLLLRVIFFSVEERPRVILSEMVHAESLLTLWKGLHFVTWMLIGLHPRRLGPKAHSPPNTESATRLPARPGRWPAAQRHLVPGKRFASPSWEAFGISALLLVFCSLAAGLVEAPFRCACPPSQALLSEGSCLHLPFPWSVVPSFHASGSFCLSLCHEDGASWL